MLLLIDEVLDLVVVFVCPDIVDKLLALVYDVVALLHFEEVLHALLRLLLLELI